MFGFINNIISSMTWGLTTYRFNYTADVEEFPNDSNYIKNQTEFSVIDSGDQSLGAPRIFHMRSGEGGNIFTKSIDSDPTSISYIYQNLGIKNISIFFQPGSVEDLIEIEHRGIANNDTFNFSDFTNVERLRTRGLSYTYNNNSRSYDAKGTLKDYPPNVKYLNLSRSGGNFNSNYDPQHWPNGVIEANTLRTNTTGSYLDIPNSVQILNVGRPGSSGLTGNTETGNNPSGLRIIDITGNSLIGITFSGLMDDCSGSLERITLRSQRNLNDNYIDTRPLFTRESNLIEFSGWSDECGDLSGPGVVSSSVEHISFRNYRGVIDNTGRNVNGLITDFSNCTSLKNLQIPFTLRGFQDPDPIFPPGKGAKDMVDALYNDRVTVPNDMNFLHIGRQNVNQGEPGNTEYLSEMPQAQIDKMVGVGTYQSDGFIDNGITPNHPTIYQYSIINLQSSTIVIEGDQTEFYYAIKSTDDRQTLVRFQSNNKIRIIGSSNNNGIYTISNVTVNGSGNTEISINETLSNTSDTSGDVFGGVFIPLWSNN